MATAKNYRYTPEQVDIIFACATKAIPRTKYGVKEAAREAKVPIETMSFAKLVLAEATKEELKAARAGQISLHTLGRLIRQNADPDGRLERLTSAQEARTDKVREDAALYQTLKDALLKLTGLPRPSDVVTSTRRMARKNTDVERCVRPAIAWLKEFADEYDRTKNS